MLPYIFDSVKRFEPRIHSLVGDKERERGREREREEKES